MNDKEFEKAVDEVIQEMAGIEESPAAPAPARPAPTKPAPGRPAPSRPPKEKPSPFNPPRPKRMPRPKNIEKYDMGMEGAAMALEDYDDEVHPSTNQFWGNIRQGDHLFAKHPLFAMYGDELSRSAYQFARDKHGQVPNQAQLGQIFMMIAQREARHREQLQEIAKQVTHMVWKFPVEQMQAEITQNVSVNQPASMEPNVDDATLQKLLNKRLTMNAIIQGSAVHAMMTVHHLVRDAIEKLDPELMRLYDMISSGSVGVYWLFDINMMLQMLSSMAVGSSEVDWPEEEGAQPTVVGKAVIFPVLVQELNKGVAELVSMHGMADLDSGTMDYILDVGDAIEHEPFLIQIGPEIWRRLLKAKPPGTDLAEFVRDVSMMEPDQLQKAMAATIENPETAAQAFQFDEPEPDDELSMDLPDDPGLDSPMDMGDEEEGDLLDPDDEYDDEEDWGLGLDDWK